MAVQPPRIPVLYERLRHYLEPRPTEFYPHFVISNAELANMALHLHSTGLTSATLTEVFAEELDQIFRSETTIALTRPLLTNIWTRAQVAGQMSLHFEPGVGKVADALRCGDGDLILRFLMGARFAITAQMWWSDRVGGAELLLQPPPGLGGIVAHKGRGDLSVAESIMLANRLNWWARAVRGLGTQQEE